jgi:uroporphyrin-III C-methyltransferase/precorrin-2 dehydrogenase/sirohydrochlorin ferrochelatase
LVTVSATRAVQPYPLGLLLANRPVLVVGGGAVATRRIPALLAAGANVTVVSPSLTPALLALVDAQRLRWVPRRVAERDVTGAWLVHVAIDDPVAAAMVSAAAERDRVFCVRADDRHAATAWTPAVTRHGPVTVAVTAGGEPRRAMAIRDAIAEGLARGAIGDRDAVTGGELVGSGSALPPGSVALVGAGPGDPELITVRGRRFVATADVVVADRLIPGLLLDEMRPDAELIDVGKIPYGPAASQAEIHRLLVTHAQAGRRVVRLKGGDPFVFGRGGEEALACAEAGVPVVIVPGVTSAIAAPAAAGIPVTHRGVAHEWVVVSGHLAPSDPGSLVDWAAVARLRGTICILMGLAHLAAITETLIEGGRSPDTPAAIVSDATTSHQVHLVGTLESIAAQAKQSGIRPPAVAVIGAVVRALTTARAS